MYSQAKELITQYDTIIIHRHSNPDGDAIGSQVGLKHAIQCTFPNKKVYVVGDDAGRFGFVPDCAMDVVSDQTYADALAIVLDSSATHLISDNRYTTAKATLRFDHHIFCEKICDVECVDTTFESCCGVICDFVRKCGFLLDDVGATALFCGMVTDSGRFRYDCTTSKTFDNASYLLQYNVDTNTIYNNLYSDDWDRISLRAEFILRVQFTDKHVAYLYNEKPLVDSYKAKGVTEFAISRGMVGVMSDVKGVDVWVNFTETDDGVLCEIRSSKYNINPVAVKYGGGGHAKASGATLPNKQTAMALLEDLNKIVGE